MDTITNTNELIHYVDNLVIGLDDNYKQEDKMIQDEIDLLFEEIVKYEKCIEEDEKKVIYFNKLTEEICNDDNYDVIKCQIRTNLINTSLLYNDSVDKSKKLLKEIYKNKLILNDNKNKIKFKIFNNILSFINNLDKIKFTYFIDVVKKEYIEDCMERPERFIMGLLQYLFTDSKDLKEFNNYLTSVNIDMKGKRLYQIQKELMILYSKLDNNDKLKFLYQLNIYLNNVYGNNLQSKIIDFIDAKMIIDTPI